MYRFNQFLLLESITFKSKPTKKGAKTEIYDVKKDGETIGQVKWSSRVMGYAFQPTKDCEKEVKDFVKDLMSKYREKKKKSKKK